MARRLLVSEKTLELNIAALILRAVQKWPGCAGALWIGLTQSQEKSLGFDERASGLPKGRYLALQFKAPARRQPNKSPYRFGIGPAQNARLLELSGKHPFGVYYVLPHYNTMARLRSTSPGLLVHTYCLRAELTRALLCTHRNSHRVESFDAPVGASTSRADVYSEPKQLTTIRVSEMLSTTSMSDQRAPVVQERRITYDDLVSHDAVAEWIDQQEGRRVRSHSLAQELRGFRLLAVR